MLFWVFDLDHTLYQLNSRYFSYSYLKKNNKLKNLLTLLPCNKIVFTNGTIGHAKQCLKIMDLNNSFHKVYARNHFNNKLKPNIYVFKKFISLNNIKIKDKIVFFEDSIENLIVAKSFGWITVLIGNYNKKLPEIDFYFLNINEALNFFIRKIMNNK